MLCSERESEHFKERHHFSSGRTIIVKLGHAINDFLLQHYVTLGLALAAKGHSFATSGVEVSRGTTVWEKG